MAVSIDRRVRLADGKTKERVSNDDFIDNTGRRSADSGGVINYQSLLFYPRRYLAAPDARTANLRADLSSPRTAKSVGPRALSARTIAVIAIGAKLEIARRREEKFVSSRRFSGLSGRGNVSLDLINFPINDRNNSRRRSEAGRFFDAINKRQTFLGQVQACTRTYQKNCGARCIIFAPPRAESMHATLATAKTNIHPRCRGEGGGRWFGRRHQEAVYNYCERWTLANGSGMKRKRPAKWITARRKMLDERCGVRRVRFAGTQ